MAAEKYLWQSMHLNFWIRLESDFLRKNPDLMVFEQGSDEGFVVRQWGQFLRIVLLQNGSPVPE